MAALRRSGLAALTALALLPAALGGCSSLRSQAVPACAHCGAPGTVVHDDGTRHAVHRFRAVDWMSPVTLLQSARAVPAGDGADAGWAGGEDDAPPMGK